MIDLTREEPLTFREATKLPFLRRNGRRPHIATLYRWQQRGINGIKLEFLQIASTKCTSKEAVLRFIERLSAGTPSIPRCESQRHRAIERAEEELAESGI